MCYWLFIVLDRPYYQHHNYCVVIIGVCFWTVAATATHQKSSRLWCYSYQPITSERGTRPHARGVAKNSLYLFVTDSGRLLVCYLTWQILSESVKKNFCINLWRFNLKLTRLLSIVCNVDYQYHSNVLFKKLRIYIWCYWIEDSYDNVQS